MGNVDLNLLVVLDALLAEGSVVGAARRLGLSTSAMSRALSRLRLATGDPLLVRAGRTMAPTPRATELRERVHVLARDVLAVLRPAAIGLDVAALDATFTIRANEGFIELFAARLVSAITGAAPHVRLRFAPKPGKDPRALREGLIDLEIGVIGDSPPEGRTQILFRDTFVGVARTATPCWRAAGSRRALCRLPSRRRLAAGSVHRPGRRCAGKDRPQAPCRRRGAGISRRGASRRRFGPDRAGSPLLCRRPRPGGRPGRPGGDRLRPSCRHAENRDLGDVASAHGCRSGASLAAQHGDNGLSRGPPGDRVAKACGSPKRAKPGRLREALRCGT